MPAIASNVAVAGIIVIRKLLMRIKNINGLSATELQQEVNDGGRFIYFSYTVSILIATFKRTSGVYLVRNGKPMLGRNFFYSTVSLLFGWWGIPFGPKYTIESLRTNLKGGKDVTDDVMATVAGYVLFKETQKKER